MDSVQTTSDNETVMDIVPCRDVLGLHEKELILNRIWPRA
jgi:hypothetical protein